MIIELAVGDAYGAGFEYAHRSYVQQHNDLSRYVKRPKYSITPGFYTDDTQMSIAIAELLIAGKEWTPLNIASAFVECFRRDSREGYAGRFYQFLKNCPDGAYFLANIQPTSEKSGAAMRAAPIGILPDIEQVKSYCKIQAALTHNTPLGINAALAASLMTHFFIYRLGHKKHLGEFIESYVDGDWTTPYDGKVRSKGWMSVRAALTAVRRNDNLSDLLLDCINFTGDVDTVATIALAAASCSDQHKNNLPEHLILSLENGTYGRNYLEKLDAQLLTLIR